MNRLSIEKRANILSMLLEGMSMRGVSRVAKVSINTVSKLLVDAGFVCARFHDEAVRSVGCSNVQADEIWSFCYAKARNVGKAKAAPENAGDVWTWTAIDSDSKLILSYLIGGRDAEYATAFMADLRERVEGRVQITTDGHAPYRWAVDDAFGSDADYAQLVKQYATVPEGTRRYSPPKCVGAEKRVVEGKPDMDRVSTSYVERSNLSMRMHMRRYTRLTNAHSKKFENHCHMVSLYTVWYNFVRTNKAVRMPPAMAAGIASSPMEITDIVKMIDENAPKPGPRGPYKKNNSN